MLYMKRINKIYHPANSNKLFTPIRLREFKIINHKYYNAGLKKFQRQSNL